MKNIVIGTTTTNLLEPSYKKIAESTRTADQVMSNILPKTSNIVYHDAYREFLKFAGTDSPVEDDFILYFDHLHQDHGLKSSTI